MPDPSAAETDALVAAVREHLDLLPADMLPEAQRQSHADLAEMLTEHHEQWHETTSALSDALAAAGVSTTDTDGSNVGMARTLGRVAADLSAAIGALYGSLSDAVAAALPAADELRDELMAWRSGLSSLGVFDADDLALRAPSELVARIARALHDALGIDDRVRLDAHGPIDEQALLVASARSELAGAAALVNGPTHRVMTMAAHRLADPPTPHLDPERWLIDYDARQVVQGGRAVLPAERLEEAARAVSRLLEEWTLVEQPRLVGAAYAALGEHIAAGQVQRHEVFEWEPDEEALLVGVPEETVRRLADSAGAQPSTVGPWSAARIHEAHGGIAFHLGGVTYVARVVAPPPPAARVRAAEPTAEPIIEQPAERQPDDVPDAVRERMEQLGIEIALARESGTGATPPAGPLPPAGDMRPRRELAKLVRTAVGWALPLADGSAPELLDASTEEAFDWAHKLLAAEGVRVYGWTATDDGSWLPVLKDDAPAPAAAPAAPAVGGVLERVPGNGLIDGDRWRWRGEDGTTVVVPGRSEAETMTWVQKELLPGKVARWRRVVPGLQAILHGAALDGVGSSRFVLDREATGWTLTGPGVWEQHEPFFADAPGADTEHARSWAERILGSAGWERPAWSPVEPPGKRYGSDDAYGRAFASAAVRR